MTEYRNLTMQELMDQLVTYTADYNRLLSPSVLNVQDFTHCKQRLAEIHGAIKDLKQAYGSQMQQIKPNFPLEKKTRHVSEWN